MNSLDDVKKGYLNIISIFTEEEKKKLYSDLTKKNIKKSSAMETVEPYFRDDSRNLLNKLLLFETKVQLPDNLLMKVDKMTMAKSIEARVPLLDHKLVEFAASIPTSLKLNGLTDKYILRKTMRGFLPRSIVNRKKHRFVVPIDAWFGNELKDVVNEILSKPNIEKRGFFNSSYIKHIINHQSKSSFYYSRQLWNLLVFEIWHKIYIEGDNFDKPPSSIDI
jgi:asparagine synthase (glutamine-hydrolysing)